MIEIGDTVTDRLTGARIILAENQLNQSKERKLNKTNVS